MGKLYSVCFGISSKSLKICWKKYKITKLAVNFSKKDAFLITGFLDKFRNVLTIKTIYVKKWGNYI